ncbi:30S ribosomal protein S9 [Candidatus Woesearchaeota archaeon]|nr:30S ribosomal protein S9 [Candidatus Woesearchaeota archaeon]
MKVVTTSGKRKTAVARATLKAGSGRVSINGTPLEQYTPKLSRLKVFEPLALIGKDASKIDIAVSVNGGGIMGQSEAVRLAISRALVEHNSSNEDTLLDYDRRLLVGDVRRKETRKPNRHGKARAKRQKSYR